jgi:NDP-sugar pyrophosphorylase family protein
MQCVILPSGVTTRLWPLGGKTFRPLLPLANVPFVHYQLSWLSHQGISEVVYGLAGPSRPVRSFVEAGRPWGLRVEFVQVDPQGSILQKINQSSLMSEWFFLLSGPFVPVDFRRMSAVFLAQDRPALMAVCCNRGLIPVGDVSYDDAVVRLYQKPRRDEPSPVGMWHSHCGLSILRRAVIEETLESGQAVDLPDLYHRLSNSGQLAGMEISHG